MIRVDSGRTLSQPFCHGTVASGRLKFHVDIGGGDGRATVKRENCPLSKPPAALDLRSPEAVFAGDNAIRRFPPKHICLNISILAKTLQPRGGRILGKILTPNKLHFGVRSIC